MESKKDRWDKIQIVGTIVGIAAIPAVVAVFGSFIEKSVKDAETKLKTVEIAVSILQEQPDESTPSALRNWAIAVINRYSEIKLSSSAIKELQENPLPALSSSGVDTKSLDYGEVGKLNVRQDYYTAYDVIDVGEGGYSIFGEGGGRFEILEYGKDYIVLSLGGDKHKLHVEDSRWIEPEFAEPCFIVLLDVQPSQKNARILLGCVD